MEARIDNNSRASPENIEVASPWYGTAVATAIVGGVFSIIVLGLIVISYFQVRVILPKHEQRLETLKEEIRSRPDNKQLILQIRQLDLRVRQVRIRRWDFSYKGSYFLLSSVVVLLVGVKCAGTFKKKVPAPDLRGDRRDEQVREAMWARWGVTTGLVILGSVALFLVTRPEIDLERAGPGGTLYPSIEQISKNWPRFRGPGGLGISAYTNVPGYWNGTTGEGILWKSKVPLPGHNSPVVWGDRVFLSGGDPNKLQVYCFDALSGGLLWTGDVGRAPKLDEEPFEVMEDTGFAAPTVVTDGRRVCAIFATGDIGCFDFDGRKLWTRNLGTPDSAYGYASSLAMYRNLILVQYDQGGVDDQKSKLIALDGFSGQTVWEMKRPVPNSWTSPIVTNIGNQDQIITCGDPWVIGYAPADGAELWRAKCVGGDVAPSPIYANGLIFAIEPYTRLVAIRPDGRGDVTKTHVVWSIEDNTPDICCPVSNGELIFLLTSDGMLTCHKVTDGAKLWEKDMRENFRASPSLVGDRLYLMSEEGLTFIIEAGTEYKELARCELGESCFASPAFADGRIYFRGLQNLYCIGKETSKQP